MSDLIKGYVEDLKKISDKLDTNDVIKLAQILGEARERGKRIFVVGNGGSAATANHFACDLGKNATKDDSKRFRIISLSENIEAVTAYGNDTGYENVFSEQMKNHFVEEGDVLITISASGSSPNILKAAGHAKDTNATVISLTGFDGGKVKEMSDININVQDNSYEKVEDMHLIIAHTIVHFFKNSQTV